MGRKKKWSIEENAILNKNKKGEVRPSVANMMGLTEDELKLMIQFYNKRIRECKDRDEKRHYRSIILGAKRILSLRMNQKSEKYNNVREQLIAIHEECDKLTRVSISFDIEVVDDIDEISEEDKKKRLKELAVKERELNMQFGDTYVFENEKYEYEDYGDYDEYEGDTIDYNNGEEESYVTISIAPTYESNPLSVEIRSMKDVYSNWEYWDISGQSTGEKL